MVKLEVNWGNCLAPSIHNRGTLRLFSVRKVLIEQKTAESRERNTNWIPCISGDKNTNFAARLEILQWVNSAEWVLVCLRINSLWRFI